jgi:hypothetical protein
VVGAKQRARRRGREPPHPLHATLAERERDRDGIERDTERVGAYTQGKRILFPGNHAEDSERVIGFPTSYLSLLRDAFA